MSSYHPSYNPGQNSGFPGPSGIALGGMGHAPQFAGALPQPVASGAPAMPATRRLGLMLKRGLGSVLLLMWSVVALSLLTWSVTDPSLTHAASGAVRNRMGPLGAIVSDLLIQTLGVTSLIAILPPLYWSVLLASNGRVPRAKTRMVCLPVAVFCLAMALSSLPVLSNWAIKYGYGGMFGDLLHARIVGLLSIINSSRAGIAAGICGLAVGLAALQRSFGLTNADVAALVSPLRDMLTRRPGRSVGASHDDAMMQAPMPSLSPAAPPAAPLGAPSQAHQPGTAQWHQVAPQHQWPQPQHAMQQPAPPVENMFTRAVAPSPVMTPMVAPRMPQPASTPPPLPAHAPAPAPHALADDESGLIARRFAPRATPMPMPDAPVQTPTPVIVPAASAPPVQPIREPEIVLSEAMLHQVGHDGTRAKSVAPGGFFDRLSSNLRRHEPLTQHYKRPSLNLLKRPQPSGNGDAHDKAKLQQRSQLLVDTLADFGVNGEIVAVRPGPVVTLFEFEPARGTKSSRVIGLADDIARSMSARAVRIAVVPGVNAIGIELPNTNREPVALRDLLETEAFRKSDAKLPLTLGKGIGGDAVIADLAKMPHLLVAGTTGSGKSVGVNAMLLSLLYQLPPEDCRLILIDPKMLELSVYRDIPHLLTPVVTDPNKALAALNWAVGEMERRYKRMSDMSVRSIEVYNNRVRNAKKHDDLRGGQGNAWTQSADGDLAPMPYIVVVVDEFADLMAVAGKEIEFAVQRLAQMARAAGIHLIMATQRPSVDVVTGTIKANFPSRISFRVTSRIDSRTILNEQGAEQLLGQGDMLYATGAGQIVRVHGPFVSDEEVEAIANHLRSLGAPSYVDGVTETPELEAGRSEAQPVDEDELYDRAVALVRAEQKASISYLQRKLGIGYNRAADVIERMETDGIVSAPNGAGKRELIAATPEVVVPPTPQVPQHSVGGDTFNFTRGS